MSQKTAIIIGGGVAGPALALCLARVGVTCTIYELRDSPATIGGAINLTPNALRFLDYVGLLSKASKLGCPTEVIELFSIASGKKLGDLPFGSVEKNGYSSLRIGRTDLQKMMLEAVRDAGVDVFFGKKLIGVEDDSDKDHITALFEDGTSATGDVLFGCDGIHSPVRSTYVEPARKPSYTGVSSAYGFAPTSAVTLPIHFTNTSINSSCNGSLLLTYCNSEKTSIYVAAVMEVAEQHGEDGWRLRGVVEEETRNHLLRRFESQKLPCIKEITSSTEDLFFYPVFTLGRGGSWHRGRALLIGDAVHAVSP
jgi:salicylate hydroxylase